MYYVLIILRYMLNNTLKKKKYKIKNNHREISHVYWLWNYVLFLNFEGYNC